MRRKSKQTTPAPRCVFCGRTGSGVGFAIFAPRFPPFGTACVDCEASLPPDADPLKAALEQAAEDMNGAPA